MHIHGGSVSTEHNPDILYLKIVIFSLLRDLLHVYSSNVPCKFNIVLMLYEIKLNVLQQGYCTFSCLTLSWL